MIFQSLMDEVRKNNDNVVHYINGQLEATLRKVPDESDLLNKSDEM